MNIFKGIDEKTAVSILITICVLLFCFTLWNIWETTKPIPIVIDEEEEKEKLKLSKNKNNEFNCNSFQDLVAERNDKIIIGNTNKYRWSQSESLDIEVYIPLINNEFININDNTSIKSKNVKIIFTSYTLSITILDKLYLKGNFYAEVIPDECNWQIDNDGDSQICLTIVKRVATARNLHWDCLIQGDDKIDTSVLGPQVHHINTDEKGSIAESIAKVLIIFIIIIIIISNSNLFMIYFNIVKKNVTEKMNKLIANKQLHTKMNHS